MGAECCSITGCRLDAIAAPGGGEDASGGGRDPARAVHRGLALGSGCRANFESVKISAAEAKGKAVLQRGRENPPCFPGSGEDGDPDKEEMAVPAESPSVARRVRAELAAKRTGGVAPRVAAPKASAVAPLGSLGETPGGARISDRAV